MRRQLGDARWVGDATLRSRSSTVDQPFTAPHREILAPTAYYALLRDTLARSAPGSAPARVLTSSSGGGRTANTERGLGAWGVAAALLAALAQPYHRAIKNTSTMRRMRGTGLRRRFFEDSGPPSVLALAPPTDPTTGLDGDFIDAEMFMGFAATLRRRFCPSRARAGTVRGRRGCRGRYGGRERTLHSGQMSDPGLPPYIDRPGVWQAAALALRREEKRRDGKDI